MFTFKKFNLQNAQPWSSYATISEYVTIFINAITAKNVLPLHISFAITTTLYTIGVELNQI